MTTSVLSRSAGQASLPGNANSAERLSLYDQYGAIAYGVILKIVPQQQQAQELLVELFASPELQATPPAQKGMACTIIRLARARALAYRQKQPLPTSSALPSTSRQAELIFDLMFCHDLSPDAIAERLQIQRSDVFTAVREFFAYHLPS